MSGIESIVGAVVGSVEPTCPIPNTHRRLDEVHRLWHQVAGAYADPEGFRVNLNATIQAARNVTFVLQKEHRAIPEFAGWYGSWQERMKQDSVLVWLVDARNVVVKEGDLKTRSTARATLTARWDERLLGPEMQMPPLMPTEAIAATFPLQAASPELRRTGVLVIERRWVADNLSQWELLDALAHCYGILATLVAEAHARCGHQMSRVGHAGASGATTSAYSPDGRLPCMIANSEIRSIALKLNTGEILIGQDLPFEADEDSGPRAAKRYGIRDLPRGGADDLLHRADWFLELAKRVLAKDKAHVPMVFLLLSGGGMRQYVHQPADQQEKFLFWQHLAHEVERTGAIGLVSVAETWMATPEDLPPSGRPAEAHRRREALDVTAAAADGRVRTLITPFSRRFGRIKFEPTQEIQTAATYYLIPVLEVWRRRAGTEDDERRQPAERGDADG